MAIALRGKAVKTVPDGTPNAVSVAQADFDVPPQSGDFLVAFASLSTVLSADGGWTTPSGWSALKSGTIDTGVIYIATTIFTKFATGAEGTYSFAFPSGTLVSRASLVGILALSGVNATTPIDTFTTPNMLTASAGSTSQDAPGLSIVTPTAWLLCSWIAGYLTTGAATWTPASGMSEAIDSVGTASTGTQILSGAIDGQFVAASGATGVRTGVVSRASPLATLGATVAIRPAIVSLATTGNGTGVATGSGNSVSTRPVSGNGSGVQVGFGTAVVQLPSFGAVFGNSVGFGLISAILATVSSSSSAQISFGNFSSITPASGNVHTTAISYGAPLAMNPTAGSSSSVSVGYGTPFTASNSSGTTSGVPSGWGVGALLARASGVSNFLSVGFGSVISTISSSGKSVAQVIGYGNGVAMLLPLSIVDIINQLLACVEDELEGTDSGLPSRICMVPGQVTWDGCDCGLLAASIVQRNPSDRFPDATLSYSACGHPLVVWAIKFTMLRCIPTGVDDLPPTCDELASSATGQVQDANAVQSGLSCCLQTLATRDSITRIKSIEQFALGTQVFIGPNGGCAGSEITIYIGMANRCDCG